jgi:hypothetical protein
MSQLLLVLRSIWAILGRRPKSIRNFSQIRPGGSQVAAHLCQPAARFSAAMATIWIATGLTAAELAPVVSADAIRSKQARVIERRTVAVVCAPAMLPALEEWKQLRKRQGIDTVHVDSRVSTPQIRRRLQEIAKRQPLKFVLLVGDADAQMAYDERLRSLSVPTFYYEANIIKRWGPEPVIATDNPFADLDGDGVPELAVGRLTADTPAELEVIIDKIIRYEQLPANGTWRRRVNLTAGVGDFGPITDAIVESAAKRFLTDGMPASYRTNLAYASWRSPYCPDPRFFRKAVLDSLSEGCLFWIYMGHGRPYRLDRIRLDNAVLPILEMADVERIQSQAGLPIAIMMACYTGAFDQPQDCLAERMLLNPQGPVAAICGSRVTMPYAMAILGTGLMDAYFEQRLETLGEVLLYAKLELGSEQGSDKGNRKLMDAMAKALNPGKDELHIERSEHQLIFHLLGDPTLRLRQPQPVELDCVAAIESGQRLKIQGVSPIAGKCLIELCCRRDGFTFDPARKRQPAETEAEFTQMTQMYRRANNRLWELRQIDLAAGPFSIEIPVPQHARGFSHARAFIQNESEYAMGSTGVYIKNSEQQTELRHSNADR